MATNEQIEALLEQLMKAPPSEHFQNMDKNAVGIRAILKYLSEADDTVTAGKISEHMKISTARVAVLLKKMVAKDLIEKDHDPTDGRIVVVNLSEHGKQVAQKLHNDIRAHVGTMIDKVGMEKMMDFAKISNEIHSVMQPPEDNLDDLF